MGSYSETIIQENQFYQEVDSMVLNSLSNV